MLIMSELDVLKIRKKIGISQKELAKRLGVHWRTVQNWEKNGGISQADYTKLCALTPVKELKPTQQYFGGEGSEQLREGHTFVPLIPISAQGGTLNDFTMSVMEYDCEKVISPIKDAELAITISGDSMYPEYPSGSQVLIKKINERAFIDWGRVYVLDTCNGIVIKRLFPSEKDGCVCCKSINPEYPPFEVNLEDVFGVYRVMLCMSIK